MMKKRKKKGRMSKKKYNEFFGVGFIFHHHATRWNVCSTVYDFKEKKNITF